MKNFPFPVTRQGWVASIFIILLCFFAYYVFPDFYQIIQDKYNRSLYSTATASATTSSEECKNDQFTNLDNLMISVYFPNAVFRSFPRWAYVRITNNRDVPLQDVKLWIDIKRREPTAPSTIILPSVFNEQTYNSTLDFKTIQPHSTVYGRIRLLTDVDASLELYMNECLIKLNPVLIVLRVKSIEALKQSAYDIFLLPPWANGVIPVLVLFSCWLIEKKACRPTEIDLFTHQGFIALRRMLFLTLAIILGLVSLIWFSIVLSFATILAVILISLSIVVVKKWKSIYKFAGDLFGEAKQFVQSSYKRIGDQFKHSKQRSKKQNLRGSKASMSGRKKAQGK